MTSLELEPATEVAGFRALGVSPEICSTLVTLGYEEPTPIQREAIPPILAGRDVLGQAGTGTGKTAAFALPLLERLAAGDPEPGSPSALVLVPTRELAMQVAQAIGEYGKAKQVAVVAVYGGAPIGQQIRELRQGVQIVVATPGRVLDHLERESLSLANVKTVVLDEADEMLDMGFAEDLEAILSQIPDGHQTALFSATLAPRILQIANQHLNDPMRISIAREEAKPGEVPRVRQVAYVVPRGHKVTALARVLDVEEPGSAIIFCSTRVEVDELVEAMNARGFRAEALHGGFSQDTRDRVMKRFRNEEAQLLIATDVAARGLDIDHVSHVINYDVPADPDGYVHRIGRTGRAGREGTAITFLEPRHHRILKGMEHATKQKVEVGTIPTGAVLKAKRLTRSQTMLREAITAGGLDEYKAALVDLAAEMSPLDLAAAALKLAHEAKYKKAESAGDQADVPNASFGAPARERREFAPRGRFGADRGFERGPRFDKPGFGPKRFGAERGFDRGPRFGADRGFERGPRFGGDRGFERGPRFGGAESSERPRFGGERGFDRGPRVPKPVAADAQRLYVGAGRIDGIRPGDLVGAIANESGLSGQQIGPISITERFSLVDVPAAAAEGVIRALRGTTIRGKKVNIRFDREV